MEEVVLNAKGERGIRLDAWAVSEDSRHFATEMQNDSDIDDVRKRSRFIRDFWTVRKENKIPPSAFNDRDIYHSEGYFRERPRNVYVY